MSLWMSTRSFENIYFQVNAAQLFFRGWTGAERSRAGDIFLTYFRSTPTLFNKCLSVIHSVPLRSDPDKDVEKLATVIVFHDISTTASTCCESSGQCINCSIHPYSWTSNTFHIGCLLWTSTSINRSVKLFFLSVPFRQRYQSFVPFRSVGLLFRVINNKSEQT